MPLNSCVLFDLDGIIIDSEPMQMEAFNILMTKLGVKVGRDDFLKLVGKRAYDNFVHIIDKFGLKEDPEHLVLRKNELYETLLHKNLHAMPGVVETIAYLHGKGVPLAIVSGSVRKHIEFILDGLGISRYFSMTLASEDVVKGKPDPEGFLRAAAQLGAEPAESFVIEDSEAGVSAGRRGGFKVIAIPTGFTEAHDFTGAFRICADMCETLEYFKQIYG